MGLLTEGSPMSWKETEKYTDHVRKHGIVQFINLYNRLKDRHNDSLKWGDEIEYMIIKFDHIKKTAKVCLKASTLLNILCQKENNQSRDSKAHWMPEYGSYMLEGTPREPYGYLPSHFNVVEANMRARRNEVLDLLESDETLLCLSSFPRLGCSDFTYPPSQNDLKNSTLGSLFVPDVAIYDDHPKFKTIAQNIKNRRGKKVIINVPIYQDVKTPVPFVENFADLGDDGEAKAAALPNHVYMDAISFGMGSSCLQVTFQACNINEAKTLYDQLAPLCPIVLALSASSPVHRGYLIDQDCKWNISSASVDDRTDEEIGLKPLMTKKFRINKSRYSSIDCYLSPAGEKFNDIELVYDKEIYNQLCASGIDNLLSQHVAHLFIRDPLYLFSEKIDLNDEEDTDHFHNIQCTNWQTMRFKPPCPNSSYGWRVEFRSIEIQLTEFENAAYAVFIALLTRVILTFQLNFLIPISKVDENLSKAVNKDAVLTEKFWFSNDLTTNGKSSHEKTTHMDSVKQSKCSLMTINEIINGKGSEFSGLVPLIQKFLSTIDIDVDSLYSIRQYLQFIQCRASGELMTTARWIREFITKHSEYKQDSEVNERINYDLLDTMDKISQGKEKCPELIGHPSTKSQENIPQAVSKAEEKYKLTF